MVEVKLWNDKREREMYENFAELFAIIKATEKLEKAYIRDLISPSEYESECHKLIVHFKTLSATLKDTVPNIERFADTYKMDCPAALYRLVTSGVPATVEHRATIAASTSNSASIVAECVQVFITSMDSLKLNMVAVDQVYPLLSDLSASLNKLSILPPDFEGKTKMKEWLSRLSKMGAADELTEQQSRQLHFDLESSYNSFMAALPKAECFKIDPASKKVYCRSKQGLSSNGKKEFSVDYDYLVIATGAQSNTFNIPGVEENCHFLKEVEDAQRIRKTVIDSFEKASLPELSDEERKRILHFVVVGGGPTGVEFAAELHDFVTEDLVSLYPKAKGSVRITLLEAADHILTMFDKRITEFAEEKFSRDGIDVKLGSMVTKVDEKDISAKTKGGEVSSIPYGMIVWSTGIGTRPVIKDFMKQIGQGNRRALATDEWLRVEGCDNIYALGDCATINQRKVMEDVSAIFSKADKDKSGTLTLKEFQEAMDDICVRYPQVELYLKSKRMRGIADLLKEAEADDGSKKNIELKIEEFKSALSQVDSEVKFLPATAQVAAQQGSYLAKCFDRMEECEKNPEGPIRMRGEGRHRFRPFRYRHLGGEQTAAQLPGDWVSIGQSSQWLWYSVYASKQVSWRTRVLVVSDWMRRFIFGRDSSSI